jgi:hypothetical protein
MDRAPAWLYQWYESEQYSASADEYHWFAGLLAVVAIVVFCGVVGYLGDRLAK